MSTTDSRETLVRAGSPFFDLAALFTLAIAGLSPALAHSADSTSAQQGASAPAARPNTAAEPTAPKGREEGIQVHGHWTIKVSNPDGKVVQHVEFENSLSPGLTIAYVAAHGNDNAGLLGGWIGDAEQRSYCLHQSHHLYHCDWPDVSERLYPRNAHRGVLPNM